MISLSLMTTFIGICFVVISVFIEQFSEELFNNMLRWGILLIVLSYCLYMFPMLIFLFVAAIEILVFLSMYCYYIRSRDIRVCNR